MKSDLKFHIFFILKAMSLHTHIQIQPRIYYVRVCVCIGARELIQRERCVSNMRVEQSMILLHGFTTSDIIFFDEEHQNT